MAKNYTVSDGKIVLAVEEAEEGGFLVTSPLDPELITKGESIAECFANARDALKALRGSRVKLIKQMQRMGYRSTNLAPRHAHAR